MGCSTCGCVKCTKKKIVFIKDWGRNRVGDELLICAVGKGVVDLLVDNKTVKLKKSAAKKTNKSNGSGSKSSRRKGSPAGGA